MRAHVALATLAVYIPSCLAEITRFAPLSRTAPHVVSSSAPPQSLGDIVNMTCAGSSVCDIWAYVGSGPAVVPLRIDFSAPAMVRYWLQRDGNFSDSPLVNAGVIIGGMNPVTVNLFDSGSYFTIAPAARQMPNVTVYVKKSPVLLTILLDGSPVVEESAPLAWNDFSSWQTLTRDVARFSPGLTAEHFFGGGMQHGHFAHRDTTITIGVDYNWDENGHPNGVPFYISSAGYGVLRNTWAPGQYAFNSPVIATHNESHRFDAFFMIANNSIPTSLKTLVGLYTQLTGTPFLPPLYGLFLGDSDCYHNDRHGNSTQVAITIGQLYNTHDMPVGWLLPNDGYGCGYGEGPAVFPSNLTDLTYVVSRLHEEGLYVGLWTSTGMPHIKDEVGVAGTRVCKTDVGWIGDGYKYAFDGVTLCANGIEQYSTPGARRFVWTVEGWAGTHRLAVMWTGDNSGSMDYVRWQIPTFVGAAFSAQAHVSGDVDGIFGGSPESYVRDLQFKSLMTVFMTMSGWAANADKQPAEYMRIPAFRGHANWTWGEPYTSFNRAALKLKAQLTPYMYSYCRIAYETGVSPVRAPLLEFPADERLYVPGVNGSSYEFLSGEWLLVAPVYEAGAVTRDGVVLPKGPVAWIDWWDGTRLKANTTLDGYDAPLSKLPLFVRAGAIVPMWPPMNYFNQRPADPMYLELWPSGATSFVLYEDDGVTRDALPPVSAFGKTLINVTAPIDYLTSSSSAAGNVTITVAPVSGAPFTGQLTARGWWLNVRSLTAPLFVVLATGTGAPQLVPEKASEAELEASSIGWFHDTALQRGLLMVKLPTIAAADGFVVTLSNGPSYPHIGTEDCDTPSHHQVENQKFAWDASTGKFNVVGTTNDCLTVGADKDPDSHTPALEVQPCAAAMDAHQQFVVQASNQIALKADTTTCLDQDVSVNRVITYGCHDPGSPGNQAWSVNPDGTSQHIVSLQNGLCMCVLAAT